MTSIWKVVSTPLALVTSPTHDVFLGNDAATFASVLGDDTTTPPPNGTVPVGHCATPLVFWPLGAVIWLVSSGK